MRWDLIVPNWDACNSVRAVVTTRAGGFSSGTYAGLNLGGNTRDEWVLVQKNRDLLVQELGLPNKPYWLNQVHGSRVVRITGEQRRLVDADGEITREKGQVCAVLTADCLPVFLCDRFGREVAIAHGGWRGLATGILQNTVEAFESKPAELLAWLGPAISQAHFEVGGEVREQFLANDPTYNRCFKPNPRGRWQADIYDLARLALELAGVRQISGGGFCTHQDKFRFFSYRRDGETGRMASLIWLD